MNTPDVPLRIDITTEVPGTPEQVWDAIATAGGISSWFIPTELEEREGGKIHFHVMDGMESAGQVTRWEPPHRFAYVEPDWAAFSGHEGAEVTPLASEFLIEARSGGTCVVRVVTSAFGSGADWERETFDDMAKGWRLFFDNLRLYLAHFAGRRATYLPASVAMPGDRPAVYSALRRAFGASEAGQPVDVLGLTGRVERVDDTALLVSVTGPVPGYLTCYAYPTRSGSAAAHIGGYLFGPDAPAYAERERPAWRSFLEGLTVSGAA